MEVVKINYKLTYSETQIFFSSGVIENNSNGLVSISIKKDGKIQENILEPNGKFIFYLSEDETIWGKTVNRIYSNINVLPLEDINIGGGSLDPNLYYTKKQIEEKLNKKIDISSEMTLEEARQIINKYK